MKAELIRSVDCCVRISEISCGSRAAHCRLSDICLVPLLAAIALKDHAHQPYPLFLMVLAATFAKFIIFGLTQQISRWNRDVPPFASSNLTGKLPPAALGCAGDERAPSGDKALCKIHFL